MSTSDAGELELRVVGGETQTPLYCTAPAIRTTTAREPQDEIFGNKRFRNENHGDETPTGQQCHSSAISQEAHKALRREEAAHCCDRKVPTQSLIEPRFTSCLLFRFASKLGLDHLEPRLKKNLDPCLHSSTETQRPETGNHSCQVNGQTLPTDISIKADGDSPLYERILAKKNKEAITDVRNELDITRDLSITHSFSNGEVGPHEHNDLHTLPCGSQPRTCTRSLDLEEDIKKHTKLENQTEAVELSNPTRTMLSSTVVTVLAPHWSGRLRRNKRFDGTGNSEAQGNLQDVTNTMESRTQDRFQRTMDRPLTDGLHGQVRAPFLGSRSNTVGWSSKSGPVSLDYEPKRKMLQTVSLDVNSGRMDNRNREPGAVSPVAANVSPVAPFSPDPNEQRRNPQARQQGELSSLSSKPTTSSLLLSLRRFNSNGRDTNAAPEINPSPLTSPTSDRDGKAFKTYLSQTFNNNNVPERSKPLLSPTTVSFRTAEPVLSSPLSPSTSNQRERTTFESRFFPASPTNKDAEHTSFIQQPQTTNRTQSSLSSSKQTFLSGGPSERQLSLDKSNTLFSQSTVSTPRHASYDRSALLKTHSLPRRTTLTSTSWWKQVTQESSSPLMPSESTKIKDKPNTYFLPPCNDKSDLASLSPTDSKRFSNPVPNKRDNNITTDSVYKSNMNLVMKTQGGIHNFKQKNAEDSSDHESDRLVKQQYGSNSNTREPQKPLSLPDGFASSKISRVTAQTTLSQPKDLTSSSFTANTTELPPTSLHPKSPDTPTESSSKYSNNHCASKTNSNPASPHSKDPERFTKPSLSLATTNTLISQVLTSKTASGLALTPNTKTSSSFQSNLVASQTTVNASSYSGSSSLAPKFTKTTNVSPLGFERTYASVPKPFQPKTSSSLTLSALPKTNYSPVSTTPTISSSATGNHPATTTVPSPSLLSPPVTPALSSSPTTITSILTPPATPVITSPNYSDSSSPKEGRTFSGCQEGGLKKKRPNGEAKRVRRVTWDDSVDLQQSEPSEDKKQEPSEVPVSSPSTSRSPQIVKSPSIFSFLRSSSPTTSPSPVCTPTPKTSSIQVEKGGKYRSLSSDSADLVSRECERAKQRPTDTMISDQGRRDMPRQERTLSVESGTVQCRSPAPLSLPPDLSSGYKLRYSSPPYSTLMSSRSTQGETKTIPPRSPLFQQPSQSNYTPHLSTHTDSVAVKSVPMSKALLSPVSLPQPVSLPFQSKTATRESSKCGVSDTDQINNNHCKKNSQDCHSDQLLPINNRGNISSQSQQGDETPSSPSTFVTESLVYTIKSKVDTVTAAPKDVTPLQHSANIPVSMETNLSQQPHIVQSKKAARELRSPSDQGSTGSSSTDESSNRRMKEIVLGKSRFFSMESNNDQSPKRSRFALKKSVSTPGSSLSRSESDRAGKPNNKMDQVLNKLRQTFSPRRSDDDMSFPWKWRRGSQTPSISGSSDISNVSDITDAGALEKREQEKVLKDNEKTTEVTSRWMQNRYTLTSPSDPADKMAEDKFYIWSDRSSTETNQDEQNVRADHMSETKTKPHLTIHSPTTHQFDFYKDNGSDYKPPNQFLSCRDPSPGRSPNPNQLGKSTPSPRSPFSPFSSLSPLSSFPSPDTTDDSVFYSPKLRRRESSMCEPGEGISLGSSRRSRASTGPPSATLGQDKERMASSYADLKYGIEPGRSFSVSSVLSSRPSGPGRISTGSRFMSVGDLSESALSCGGVSKDLDRWSISPDWTKEHDCQPRKDCRVYFPSDPGKMRSRSLPRSLTRRLANWSSGVSASSPGSSTASKPARPWSPNMNICHFSWDVEGPPTPPPTPPLSPVTRRMSKPPSPSLSSPTFPGSPGAPQQVDSQASRVLLPSRGYVSSLSTFEESSDSGSDTTTDDEYYLETGGDGEKETEL